MDASTPLPGGDPGALFPSPGESGVERDEWEGARTGGLGGGVQGEQDTRVPAVPSPSAP